MSFIIAIVAIVIAFIIGAVIFVKTRNVSLPAQFNAINNYIKSGNPRGAVRLCKNIIAKNPENYDAHYFMGLAYLNLNQDELALEELKTFDKAGV
ncbi:MAG: tetratricopeptide repeat protein, partial [Spirochaetales bacterium]|nr:tetratricopeptide repeat protein [Spirochaetales bacterium]